MLHLTDQRIAGGLQPKTLASYVASFKLFLSVMVYMGLNQAASLQTVVIYFKYLAQNNIRASSMRNHLSVLKHYFGLINWPTVALTSRKVMLLIKSVQMNAKLWVSVKSVMSITLLEKMLKSLSNFYNGVTYRALFLMAYFGFFRLASLVPNSVKSFDETRYPVFGDVIWGPPGFHLILTCAKNMQTSGDYQVVQLPKLDNYHICPVAALKAMIAKFNYANDTPLFLVHSKALKLVVIAMVLNPSQYTFHMFRRSGASLAFDNNIQFENIKQHGNWQSEAIWHYLKCTPNFPTTFKQTYVIGFGYFSIFTTFNIIIYTFLR